MKRLGSTTNTFQVKITKVEQSSQFIRITAQNEEDVEYNQLLNLLRPLYLSSPAPKDEDVQLGDIFLCKHVCEDPERCRILDFDNFSSTALVDLFDSGYHKKVPYSELRTVPKCSAIRTIRPVGSKFILASLMVTRDDPDLFAQFTKLIINKSAKMVILNQSEAGKFVEFQFAANASLAHDIILQHPILKDLFKCIALDDQIKQMGGGPKIRYTPLVQVQKECTNFGEEHQLPIKLFSPGGCEVTITAYANETKEFFVQLIDAVPKYKDFCVRLHLIRESLCHVAAPVLGMTYTTVLDNEDVLRIIVLERVAVNLFVVQDLDTGRRRVVKAHTIYQLPDELKIEPFAWPFRLSGFKSINHLSLSEFNFFFIYLTTDKTLNLKLDKKATKKDEPNLCSLYDGKQNVLNLLRNYDPRALHYPAQKLPEIGKPFKAQITSINSPTQFFVVIADSQTKETEELLEEFATFNSCVYKRQKLETACCIRKNGKNYRGKIISQIAPGIMTCQSVDFGHIDDYNEEEIKVMVNQFTTFAPLAYECSLFDCKKSKLNLNIIKSFKNICANSPSVTVIVKQVLNGKLLVTLETSNKKMVADEIMKPIPVPSHSRLMAGVAIRREINPAPVTNYHVPLNLYKHNWSGDSLALSESLVSSFNEENSNISSSSEKLQSDDVVITAVVSPNDFTMQLVDDIPKMQSFLNGIQGLVDDSILLTEPEKERIYVAKSPYTNNWFRAMVLDSSVNEKITLVSVLNVDDGSTFTYDTLNAIKKCPYEATMKEYFGIRCALPVKVHKKNEKKACEMLLNMVNKKVSYKVLFHAASNQFVIDIIHDGKSMIDEMVNADLAVKLQYIPNGGAFGKVTHVENLREFYVVFEEEADFKRIMCYTQKYRQKSVEAPKAGMLIMVRNISPKTETHWFRAKVLSRINEMINVKRLDFGNTLEVHQHDLGAIDPKMANIKPAAYRCSLYLPKEFAPTDAANEHFQKIALAKEFNVQLVNAEVDRAEVQLFTTSPSPKDITSEITPHCDVALAEEVETTSGLSTISEVTESASET